MWHDITVPEPPPPPQEVMRRVVRGVGGLDHRAWRGYSSPHPALGRGEVRQFVDGDLIEQFLDLR